MPLTDEQVIKIAKSKPNRDKIERGLMYESTLRVMTEVLDAQEIRDEWGYRKLLSIKPTVAFGSELITNGGFDTDSDWIKVGSATISGGYLNLAASGDFAQQSITNPSQYVVIINVSSVTTSGDLRIRSNNSSTLFKCRSIYCQNFS